MLFYPLPRPLITLQRDTVQQVRQLSHILGRRVRLRRREHAHQRPRREVVRPVRAALPLVAGLTFPLGNLPHPVEFIIEVTLVSSEFCDNPT